MSTTLPAPSRHLRPRLIPVGVGLAVSAAFAGFLAVQVRKARQDADAAVVT